MWTDRREQLTRLKGFSLKIARGLEFLFLGGWGAIGALKANDSMTLLGYKMNFSKVVDGDEEHTANNHSGIAVELQWNHCNAL